MTHPTRSEPASFKELSFDEVERPEGKTADIKDSNKFFGILQASGEISHSFIYTEGQTDDPSPKRAMIRVRSKPSTPTYHQKPSWNNELITGANHVTHVKTQNFLTIYGGFQLH